MSKFSILKGNRVIATADTLAEAERYAKAKGARVLQVIARRQVRANPSAPDDDPNDNPYHDAGFWAGEFIGEIVDEIREKAPAVYYDEDAASLEFDGRVCSLGYDRDGTILVTKLSFDDDDNMTEKFLRFGPAKSWADGQKIVAKAVEAILARDNPAAPRAKLEAAVYKQFPPDSKSSRGGVKTVYLTGTVASVLGKPNYTAVALADLSDADLEKIGHLLIRRNPSAAEHADFAHSDLSLAREGIAIARRQTNTTDRRDAAKAALSDARLAMRESKHSGRADLQKQAMAAEDEAYEALIGQPYRRNGSHPAESWAHSDRKPAIDFGELGHDKQALTKWLQEHPGQTAAFRSAGKVYHSCNHDGQVFTVPASRRNGEGGSRLSARPAHSLATGVGSRRLGVARFPDSAPDIGRNVRGLLFVDFDPETLQVHSRQRIRLKNNSDEADWGQGGRIEGPYPEIVDGTMRRNGADRPEYHYGTGDLAIALPILERCQLPGGRTPAIDAIVDTQWNHAAGHSPTWHQLAAACREALPVAEREAADEPGEAWMAREVRLLRDCLRNAESGAMRTAESGASRINGRRGGIAGLYDAEEARLEKIYASDPAHLARQADQKRKFAAEAQAVSDFRAQRIAQGKGPGGFLQWTKPLEDGGHLYSVDDDDKEDAQRDWMAARRAVDAATAAIESHGESPELRAAYDKAGENFRAANGRYLKTQQWAGAVRTNGTRDQRR